MKKRILSLALALSMLVGMFTVFATVGSAATDSSVPSSSGKTASTYLDLYVKDGLVALFDGMSKSASDEALSVLTPENLYGASGYDAYVDPSRYTADIAGGTFDIYDWYYTDGAITMKYKDGMYGDRSNANYVEYVDLSDLGAIIGTTYTVQEIFTQTPMAQLTVSDGKASFPTEAAGGYRYDGLSFYGALRFVASYRHYEDGLLTGKWSGWDGGFNVPYMQMVAPGSSYRGHHVYAGANYGSVTLDGVTYGIANVSGKYLNNVTAVERSVLRYGYEGSGSYTSTYAVWYAHAPLFRTGNYMWVKTMDPFTFSSSSLSDHNSTKLEIMSNAGASYHSVRIYNVVLAEAELLQNHLADLCGYYGVDVGAIFQMTEENLSALIDAAKSLVIVGDKTSEKYTAEKTTLENLIKRYGPALSLDDEAREKNAYDALYLGSDGKKTVNGGSLVALFSAYKGDTDSVDLDLGLWYNKVSQADASINGGKYSSDKTTGWKLRENGGLGYDLTIAPDTASYYMKQESCANVLSLPKALISSADFTVEYSASYLNYKLADGTEYGTGFSDMRRTNEDIHAIPTDRIGYLGNYATRAGSISSTGGVIAPDGSPVREVRWYVGKPGESWSAVYTRAGSYGSGQNLWGYKGRATTLNHVQTVTRDEAADGNSAAYSIYANAERFGGGTWTYSADSDKSFFYYPKTETNYVFELFNQAPVTVYAIRVYSATLTEAEMKYNLFIDTAAYYGADLSAFANLGVDMRTVVTSAMANFGFGSDKEAFEAALAGTLSQLVFEFDTATTLYVTDGLTTFLSAYNTVSTGDFQSSDTELLWYNGVGEGSVATLKGTGWKRNVNGGYTIVKTVYDYDWPNASTSLYRTKEDYAVILAGSMLPDADFTVEYVANPVGLSKEDGTRYIDATSKFGIYHENSTAIGPLRAMQFNAQRSGLKAFERRWVYGTGTDPYGTAAAAGTATGGVGNLPGYKNDYDWDGLGLNEVITMSITLSTLSGDHSYNFYKDSEKLATALIDQGAVITPDKADNRMFRLMGGMAGTIYSVRVYDRVLSEGEMAQNHFADLVYYYDIDISALRDAMDAMGDISAIAAAFTEMDFSLTKEEAQAYFDAHMAEIWLSYNGYAVKNDLSDGLRFYFDIKQLGIDSMLGVGAKLEIGTLVNIGKSALPKLEGYAYDYKVVAYDSEMGKTESIFIDNDTYAVTIRYENADKVLLLRDVSFQSYVKLVMADGTTTVYYLNLGERPDDLFEYYKDFSSVKSDELSEDESLKEYVDDRIESCYTTSYIYLDAAASADGNGSEDAPFHHFEDAFDAVKQAMREAVLPTHIILSAKDGTYSVSEVQTLTESDKVYAYTDLAILSENGGATLTTTKDITESFTSLGSGVYTYQFAKDANGKYPEFRHLYVNGKMADLAHQGDTTTYLGTYVTASYDRPFNAAYQIAMDDAKAGKLTFTSALPENYASRPDLAEVYNYYRPYAIAYWEVVGIYNRLRHGKAADFATDSAALANATASKGAGASASDLTAYTAAFAEYKMKFLARYEAECYAHDLGPRSAEFAAVTTQNTDATYVSFFNGVRNYLASVARTNYQDVVYEYPIDVAQKSGYLGRDYGKIYISEVLVGGLRDLVLKGKVDMVAYVDELTAEYDALLASLKADSNLKATIAKNALAAYVALKSLEEVSAEDFISTLDQKIADAEAAYATASDEDKGTAKATLDAYTDLKTALNGKDDVLAAYAQVLESKRIASVEADEASTAKATEFRDLNTKAVEHEILANEVKDEYLWVRHSLALCDIEFTLMINYMMDVNDINGVDFEDYYVDEKGVTHYATYLENYSSLQIPANAGGSYNISGHHIYLTNELSFLDSDNEYYYDLKNGTLYYYSANGVDGMTFSYPTSDNLLKFVGVDNLKIEGFSFTGVDDYHMTVHGHNGTLGSGDYDVKVGVNLYAGAFPDRAALYLKDITNLSIERCSFYELGCEAITARGWMENAVVNECFFENIGGSGIRFGENIRADEPTLSWVDGAQGNKNITITENYLHNISRNYLTPALQVTTCLNGLIQYNTIENCTYSAISVGWQWAYSNVRTELLRNVENMEIANNFVSGFMRAGDDGGAIYVAGPNTAVEDTRIFNSIHDNYILYNEKTGDGMGGFNPGIYFDGASSAYKCYNNVIVEPGYGATASESDYAKYGVSDQTADRLEAARDGASAYIYLQHITDQEVHNILLEDNYILNVRSTTKDAKRVEIYNSWLDVAIARNSNVIEYNTVYVVGMSPDVLPREVAMIIPVAGATGYNGIIEDIVDNVY